MGAITQAMERSGTRRDFLRAMERRGYQVAWEDNGSTSPTPLPADKSAGHPATSRQIQKGEHGV